ncbi:MAG TPA: hypothetical protein VKG26_13420 [Bacteroidia bacterium]|nr:hypothetical protein [Bacteroidia bacterium]
MRQKIKIILFIFLFALLWLPFIQEQTKFIKEPELNGAFIKPTEPKFSIDSLSNLSFQQQYEKYKNYMFGFKGLLIKIKNSVNYILFKELSVEDNIAGKNGYIFSIGSINKTLGIDYNGKEKNEATLKKINFLKEEIESNGGHLIVLLIPSKETVLPEFLPSKYKGKYKNQTDYDDFIEGYKKYHIPVIDYCAYFKQIKKNGIGPLFTKTGFHWCMYGASIAQDTLVNYIENIVNKPIPKYKRIGIEMSDTARESDADFEPSLNLLFSLGQSQYVYPKLKMLDSTRKNYRPKVIIIGDSYFWQIKHQKMLMNIFTEDSKFWYYFATTSFPIGDVAGVPLKDINIMHELETADIVLLNGNISTLSGFPFGITDYYYNNVSNPAIIDAVQKIIKGNSLWMEKLNATAAVSNVLINEVAETNARVICRNKRAITLKASNGKYICAGGDEDKILLANREAPYAWETFYMLQLDDNKIAIYSYKNKFLSAELSDKTEITSAKTNIDAWETFTLQNLDNDFVAIKACNGKYLSLDKHTQQLFANADKIGVNEKFKITFVK